MIFSICETRTMKESSKFWSVIVNYLPLLSDRLFKTKIKKHKSKQSKNIQIIRFCIATRSVNPFKILNFEVAQKRKTIFSQHLNKLFKYFSKCSKSVCSLSFLPCAGTIEKYHFLYENMALETHTCWKYRMTNI